MLSKGNHANEAEKVWRTQVAEFGCVVTGSVEIQIHHCVGSTAKQNKIPIGHWFILPLNWRLHDISSGAPDNITLNKREFEWRHGTEKELFAYMVNAFKAVGKYTPPTEILTAIQEYRK